MHAQIKATLDEMRAVREADAENPQNIASLTAEKFNVSRQAIFRYTQKLENNKMLISEKYRYRLRGDEQ